MTRLIDADMCIAKIKDMPVTYDSETVQRCIEVVSNSPTVDVSTDDTKPHWIPCSERLPEDDRSKVVTLANGNAEVGYYSNGDWWCVGDKFTLENPTVIAWMPLPEAYEVKE